MGCIGSKPKSNTNSRKPSATGSEKPQPVSVKEQNSTQPKQQEQNTTTEPPNDADDDYEEIVNKGPKKVTQDDFELLQVIGRGSFGKVMLVRKKDDRKIYAMKVLRKDVVKKRNQVDHTKSEKEVLTKIHHPFIVQLHYAFQTKEKLYMIMDFANGGELFHHLKNEQRFDEPRAKFYAAEIGLVLHYIHSQGIIYRDLKPENILLDSTGHVVITDFGLSKELGQGKETKTFCGTPDYLAPEILKGVGHGVGVDWWSLGILIYEMLVGIPPFYDEDVSIMYQKILKSQPQFPKNLSYEAKCVVMGLLEKEPEERLTGEEFMKMDWFKDIDFDKLLKKEISPPWVPPVKDEIETTQIDEEFIDEKAEDTPPNGNTPANPDNTFEGFTFVQNTALGENGTN
ncbi:protein kinase, putative [Entamoeba invadens IP1]|uniref:non-specific serine/threonine protein kinase n=1 Tax=Entamoeba invadens IP1 TaxID=370355 RepID=A0A0A1U5I9_ENTIV|nr:protein kinase, putative [Entamoeba invadens IP1]ELP88110.1 protein kinase, putative [Entamoeba invadens IP1]|eukprot:XP_004254881.1 protein kinase, putative [Entamoeba invadens IP1]